VVISTNLGTIGGNLTGLHNGADDSANLVDTTKNFSTLGVVAGQVVFNATDGSSGQITAISTTTNANDTLEMTLAGGTDNNWDIGDSYQVMAGEYGEVIQIDADDQYIFSNELGGMQALNVPTGNLLIQYYRYPGLMTDASHYPEVYRYFQKALPYGAAQKLLEEERTNSRMAEQAQYCMAMWNNFLQQAKVYESISHGKQRSFRSRPRMVQARIKASETVDYS
jgi:hypothetical protein